MPPFTHLTDDLVSFLNETLAASPAIVFRLNASPPFELQYVSPNFTSLLNISTELLKERGWQGLVHADDFERVHGNFIRFLDDSTRMSFTQRYRFLDQEGDYRWVSVSSNKIYNTQSVERVCIAIAGAVIDIDDEYQKEDALRRSQALLSEVQRIARIGHWVSYPERNELNWSGSVYEILALEKDDFKPSVSAFMDLIHPDDATAEAAAYETAKVTGKYEVEHRICTPKGRVVWVHEIAELIYENGTEKLVGTLRDITEQKELQLELAALAQKDSLTGIFNHGYFMATLDDHFKRFLKRGTYFSVVVFDLDDFKLLNDTHGHVFGDQVLLEVVRACAEHCRSGDLFARIGGEEFALLLPDTTEPDAAQLSMRMAAQISNLKLVTDAQESVRVTASFGVAQTMPSMLRSQDLLRLADQRMYQNKQAKKS